jgi:hypothetical protein
MILSIIYLSIYLPIYLSTICLCIYVCIYVSIHLSSFCPILCGPRMGLPVLRQWWRLWSHEWFWICLLLWWVSELCAQAPKILLHCNDSLQYSKSCVPICIFSLTFSVPSPDSWAPQVGWKREIWRGNCAPLTFRSWRGWRTDFVCVRTPGKPFA